VAVEAGGRPCGIPRSCGYASVVIARPPACLGLDDVDDVGMSPLSAHLLKGAAFLSMRPGRDGRACGGL
jgi:hypothetical protein